MLHVSLLCPFSRTAFSLTFVSFLEICFLSHCSCEENETDSTTADPYYGFEKLDEDEFWWHPPVFLSTLFITISFIASLVIIWIMNKPKPSIYLADDMTEAVSPALQKMIRKIAAEELALVVNEKAHRGHTSTVSNATRFLHPSTVHGLELDPRQGDILQVLPSHEIEVGESIGIHHYNESRPDRRGPLVGYLAADEVALAKLWLSFGLYINAIVTSRELRMSKNEEELQKSILLEFIGPEELVKKLREFKIKEQKVQLLKKIKQRLSKQDANFAPKDTDHDKDSLGNIDTILHEAFKSVPVDSDWKKDNPFIHLSERCILPSKLSLMNPKIKKLHRGEILTLSKYQDDSPLNDSIAASRRLIHKGEFTGETDFVGIVAEEHNPLTRHRLEQNDYVDAVITYELPFWCKEDDKDILGIMLEFFSFWCHRGQNKRKKRQL